MANRTILTAEKIDEFLEVLADSANVSRAAERIDVSRSSCYERRHADEDFRKRWDAAVELGLDALEDEVTRRGVEGWEEPVWYQGVQCGLVRKFSDSLLMFRLNGGRPEKYRQRVSAEHTGKGGGPIETKNVDALTDEQLAAIASAGRPAPAEPETGAE